MPVAGATFEDYVHFVYDTLLNLREERVQVSKRTTFRLPSGESYEVDIYYEFMHVGVRHRVAIECKDWKNPVDQGQILEFQQKIKNIGDDIVGVFVSRVGYQAGAKRVAERHGILTLSGGDIPSLGQLVARRITSVLLPESHCVGEPFWYIAELSKDSICEGTGNYYAFPENHPLRFPLFFSKRHAEAFLSYLPDKDEYGVFGMPQYKLKGLLFFALRQNLKFGLVFEPPASDGKIAFLAVDAQCLKDEYLLDSRELAACRTQVDSASHSGDGK